ncbi:MAG: bifunctional serine/threonine-protein kinase/formylglycine-generating enzyme family protein [Bryobacteraceae bacterium]|nr:bifunctional serine/threonine-protein kinase/formylglycine-generating enzyme family protein [Bryobacteraceae bacterium]
MQLPARLGKYELQEFLGGGMSHVYRAKDTVIDRDVVVKILTEQGSADPDAKARFHQEAKMAGNISHDNVLSIFDYGEEQGRPYIVMEYLVGEDLRDAIRNENTGDIENRLKIALQIARALEYVHSKRIIHRDVKPENIFLDRSGKVKLMDFGIAKSENFSMTKTGLALGSPYYMAPEQVLGKTITEAVDIYAYGVVLYELLTGIKPVTGDSLERLFYVILHENLDLTPLAPAGVPQPVIELLARCTAKKPEDRPQLFTEIVAVLEKVVAPEPLPAKRSLAPLWAGLLAAVAIVAMIVVVANRDKKPPPKKLEPVIATESGEMILVPAGAFLSGPAKEKVEVGPFYIDKTEVTNALYAKFCEAKKRPLPPGFSKDKPDHPVVNITITDAREFARWAGKRLPTSAEWEKVARGLDGRVYPWGDQADTSKANVADNAKSAKAPVAVSAFSEGVSPFKALNLVGNVWEFVDDLKTPSPAAVTHFAQIMNPPATAEEPWYSIRGGSFDVPLAGSVPSEFASIPARFAAPNIGFRCAKDP